MRLSRRSAVIIHDLLMIMLAWELAWLARFNFELVALTYWWANLRTLPVVMLVQGVVSWRCGLYSGLWRFVSVADLLNIIRVAVLGVLAVTLILFIAMRLQNIPRSLLLFYPLFLVFLLGGPRFAYRLWKDRTLNLRKLTAGTRVLVIGAGQAGETIARQMLRDPDYLPIGFVDDKERFRDSRIHGIPVLGQVSELGEIVTETIPDFLVIAIPSATDPQMQRIVDACDRTGVRYRTLPRGSEINNGASYLSDLRDVSIEDLLGREVVNLDWKLINQGLAGKQILVTGGGGSIGSELCRQIARIGPSRLIVVEQSEYKLFLLQRELRAQFPSLSMASCLADVCDAEAMDQVFERYRPNIVFHAAAYKHVALLEHQVREAVRNNIIGTKLVAETAVSHGVLRFVLISSDKAVKPASVMGSSKRVAELVCSDLNKSGGTQFVAVRFGNVLASDGSVVPLFKEQIAAGGPVTVTHPDATRYFMTIPEACQLIMQTAVIGDGGDLYVLDMGEPVSINYLAEQMIRLSGNKLGDDLEIQFIGLGAGEKLHEELFYDDEKVVETAHPKIQRVRNDGDRSPVFREMLHRLVGACRRFDDREMTQMLRELVPQARVGEDSDDRVVPFTQTVCGSDE